MRRLSLPIAVLVLLPARGLAKDRSVRHPTDGHASRKRVPAEADRPKPDVDTDLGLPPGTDRDYDGVPDRRDDDPERPDDDE